MTDILDASDMTGADIVFVSTGPLRTFADMDAETRDLLTTELHGVYDALLSGWPARDALPTTDPEDC